LCTNFPGVQPYKEVATYKGTKVPKELLDNTLPESLQTLLPVNRKILLMVLNFDPNKRMSAADWLLKLDGYQLTD